MKEYPIPFSDRTKPAREAGRAVAEILVTGIIILLFLIPAVSADNYEGGIPLEERKEGTVSGGIWMDSYYGMSSPAPVTVEQGYRLPDHTAIKWARLYVTVYCGNMEENYAGTATVEFDGGSGYSQMGMESLSVPYTFPGKDYNPPAGVYGTGPVSVNDHCVRVTSDYLMWYDVTSRCTGEEVKARVSTAPADPRFDGRIKAVTLVVAYDDGDEDTVRYWIMDGLDTDSYHSDEKLGEDYLIRTTFPTGELPPEDEWAGARLQVVHLASDDATYALNEEEPVDRIASAKGSYSGYNAWDVTGIVTPWEDTTLSCDRTGSYYKIFLAALSVRYPEVETGTLTVTSSPAGAVLCIDGEETEYTTNATIPDMPVGSYALSVEHELCHDAEEQWVDITADGTTAVHFDLEPVTGSLHVMSDPAGAEIYIDNEDTGLVTEAFLNDVIIGEHTVSVRLPGYRDAVQAVTVAEDETSEVSFGLTPAADGGDGDDTAGNTGYTGKELTLSCVTTLRGGAAVVPFGTYTGLIEPGTISRFAFNASVPDGGTPVLARLYLYTTWGHTTEGKTGTEVLLDTALDSSEINPDEIYTDRKGEGSYDYVLSTVCYNITEPVREKQKGMFELSVKNSGHPGEVCALYGGMVVVLYENESAPIRTIWLNEGCDAIIADDAAGITPEDATTTIPFPGNISTGKVASADLTVISTAATGKGDDAHRVMFGEWEYDNVLTGGPSGISRWTETVTPFLLSSGNSARVQSAQMGATGDYMENRNALFVITYADTVDNTPVESLQPDIPAAASAIPGTGKETFPLSFTGDHLCAGELKTADGQCTLYIREGTRILDAGTTSVSTVTIQQKDTLPGSNAEWTYAIGPAGASADIPLILEIADGTFGTDGEIMLRRYDGDTGAWRDAGLMNRRGGTASAEIHLLGTYTAAVSNHTQQITDSGDPAEIFPVSALTDALPCSDIREFLCCFTDVPDTGEEEPDASLPVSPSSGQSLVYQAPEETYIDYRNGTYDLVILSNPPEALVILDGSYTGETTPCTIPCVGGGSHNISVSREGFTTADRDITLTDDSEIRFDLSTGTYGLNKLKFEGYITDGYDEGVGGIVVSSYPGGADIYLDGRNTGLTTPEVIVGLKEGRHTIKVHSDLTEYPSDLKSIWVYPGVITEVSFDQARITTRAVELTSDEYGEAEFTINGRYPRYTFPKEVEVSGVHPYITIRQNSSYISVEGNLWQDEENTLIYPQDVTFGAAQITSEPVGAEIFVDGFATGLHTPYTVGNLSAGPHRIFVFLPGHLPEEKEIYLVPGISPVDTDLLFLLESYPYGSLNISSEPEGAKIYLYNKYSGMKTPTVFRYMDIGTIPVRLVSAQGTTIIENAIVCPFETAEYRVNVTQSE